MKRICILVLAGLPSAGKTTFCKWFLNIPQQKLKILHFCYDEFFKIDHFVQPAAIADDIYKSQRQQILEMLENSLQAISDGQDIPVAVKSKIGISRNDAQDGYVILLDDNHYYRSMRYKIYQLCRRSCLAFGQIYFKCNQQTCLGRNRTRSSGRLPTSVIEKMIARFEAPSNIYHWEAVTLTIGLKDDGYTMDRILKFVSRAFDNVPQNEAVKVEVPCKTENSLLHSLDILLRRRMSELLNAESCINVKCTKAAELNKRRKAILQQYRDFDLDEAQLSDIVDLLDKK